jgi:hypothetical protein
VTCKLTWQNVRVRPTTGTPLALGNLTRTGTANVVGLSTNANLGTLREVAGAASSLAIVTQPSATATAGVALAQQPAIAVLDQFGNLRNSANGNSDNTTLVSATSAAGVGTLQGTLSLNAMNGLVAYTNLSLSVATNATISFSSSGLTGATSSVITASPAASPSPLVAATQPTDLASGSSSGTQSAFSSLASGNGTAVMTDIWSVSEGIKVTFAGGANSTYQIQRAVALQPSGTVWTNIGSATTDSAGNGQFIDTNPPQAQGYYRTASQ